MVVFTFVMGISAVSETKGGGAMDLGVSANTKFGDHRPHHVGARGDWFEDKNLINFVPKLTPQYLPNGLCLGDQTCIVWSLQATLPETGFLSPLLKVWPRLEWGPLVQYIVMGISAVSETKGGGAMGPPASHSGPWSECKYKVWRPQTPPCGR